ncbi:YhcN/YlaJ family sporulation lipoprotein [Paenibacillus alginolyticus]|uniref:YhcN/YlaJ family sporulation lipoprotein n=1 Tax=Paenibacillus alginolyticus TaxID=59839 RepID=UPI000FDCDDA3
MDNRSEVAKQAADKIVRLPGIRQANVLATRTNAYVATVIDTSQGQLTREMEDQITQ